MTGLAIGTTVLIAGCFGAWSLLVILPLVVAGVFRFGAKTALLAPLAILTVWWVAAAQPELVPPVAVDEERWNLEITSMPLSRERGFIFDAEILEGPASGLHVWVMTYGEDPVALGDRIYGQGTMVPSNDLDNGFGAYVEGRGDSGQLTLGWHEVDAQGSGILSWIDRQRQAALVRLQNAIPGDAGVLLSGLVTGDDGRLSDEAGDAFQRAGLSHLTAVSGANLSAIAAMVLAIGAWSGRRHAFWLYSATAATWFYAIVVGLSPPTLRAALVATGATMGRLAGRPIDLLTITLLSGAVQIAIRPVDAHSISFQLSMAASIGIAAALTRYPPRGGREILSDALLATLYAQIATLPLVAWTFRDLPLLGLFSNIVAAPLAAVAFPIGVIGALLLGIAPVIGTALLVPAAFACRGLIVVAKIYGKEWASVPVPQLGISLLLIGLVFSVVILLVAGGEGKLLVRSLRRT
jgi:ComEC/Rec2-related protein